MTSLCGSGLASAFGDATGGDSSGKGDVWSSEAIWVGILDRVSAWHPAIARVQTKSPWIAAAGKKLLENENMPECNAVIWIQIRLGFSLKGLRKLIFTLQTEIHQTAGIKRVLRFREYTGGIGTAKMMLDFRCKSSPRNAPLSPLVPRPFA
jgi:hypothetical protein